MDVLRIIANIIALTAIIPVGEFIYYYGTEPAHGKWYRRKPSTIWRTTDIGRTLMYQKIAWFIFLAFIMAGFFLDDYPGKEILRVLVYAALVSLFWRVLFTLRRVQKPFEKE